MSTNTEPSNWLDEGLLQQLANQYFKAAPGSEPVELTPNPAIAQAPLVPVAGPTGNAPLGTIGRQESFDIKDPQSSLPDPHFTDGKVPASVAGSGRSPAMNKAAASNPSPSQGASAHAAAAPAGYPFESDLGPVFQAIAAFVKGPQLPDVNFREPEYYFLPGGRHAGSEGAQHPLTGVWSERAQHPLSHVRDLDPIGAGSGLTAGINGLTGLSAQPFDVNAVRSDFPILRQLVNGRPLIWLDNAATTQKPQQVIDRISYFYQNENSNIHRAAHELAARATDAYEGARKKVQEFLNAASPNEIVFVRGATEAINLVAKSWGEQHLSAGDEVIVSHLEHHANIVPWQQLAEKKGIKLRVIPVDDRGQLLLNEYAKLLNSKTKLVSITQVSNALGTITPVQQVVAMAHAVGAKVLVDGAQSVSHMRVDVQAIDADWFVLSGHKLFAPTGIGILYGKEGLLNAAQPWQGGGNMIKDVTFEHTQYQAAPGRFEAGTGNIADAVGLGAAIDYISRLGMERIAAYEHYLLEYATRLLQQVPGLHLIGTAEHKASVLSFILDGFTNDQVGQALNKEGIAVRTGHHCAQPILRRFGVESTVRPSLAFYNTCGEIDVLVNVLHRLRRGR